MYTIWIGIDLQQKSFSYYIFTWSMVTWGRIGQTACPRDWFVTSVITVILTVALHGHCNTGHGPGLTRKPSRGAGLSNITFTIMITDGFTLCSWIHFKEAFEIHNTHRLLIIEIAGYFNLKKIRRRIRIQVNEGTGTSIKLIHVLQYLDLLFILTIIFTRTVHSFHFIY